MIWNLGRYDMGFNYKKIIKNRSMRLKILEMLSFVPDKMMIKIQYFIKTGNRLNLKSPQRFTEKLQWYKLYYKNPIMIQCVDKFDVREYVKSKGLEDILIPCYGVYDSVEQINWDELPNQFVMKDTLGGGGNSVIIVKDKKKTDIEELKRKGREWIDTKAHVRNAGREWPYYSGKNHRIIIEKYIEVDEKDGLIDYKFFCFNGKIEFIYVMGNREVGEKVNVSIYDAKFNKLDVIREGDDTLVDVKLPDNFSDLCRVVEILAENFLHVRVDLYDNENTINFGELTFYNASGYMKYQPDEFDYIIGEKFKLENY